LTYSQWLDNKVLSNPLDGQTVTSLGYAENYGNYSAGWINPEYGYWKTMNDVTELNNEEYTAAEYQTYAELNINNLYNGKKFQDVLLNLSSSIPEDSKLFP
jgi:hypothetical protein